VAPVFKEAKRRHSKRKKVFATNKEEALRGGEEGGEVPGEDAVAEKEGTDGATAQKGGKGEAVLEGFPAQEKEDSTHHAPACEGEEGAKEAKPKAQKKPQGKGELHIPQAHATGEKKVEKEEEGKKNQGTEKMQNPLACGGQAKNPKNKEHPYRPVRDAEGQKVNKGDDKEDGKEREVKQRHKSDPPVP
jgi:hypothetical protein